MWPFRAAVDYVCSETNDSAMQQVVATWHEIREVYRNKDKSKRFYYLANASGNPPILAKERDRWPKGQTISDSKTSAGMDRTDDIKKGMYQTLKLGSVFHKHPEIKTAIVSNLPAYRHADEYVKPILSMLWGHDRDIETDFNIEFIQTSRMRRVVDYLITLDGDEPY